jgi:hypothetical protein
MHIIDTKPTFANATASENFICTYPDNYPLGAIRVHVADLAEGNIATAAVCEIL